MEISYKKFILVSLIGIFPLIIDLKTNLNQEALKLLFIFIATIFSLILKPLPSGVSALVSIASLNLLGILTTKEIFTGFSQPVVWLVIFSLGIAISIAQSGLGRRIAFMFIKAFGRSPMGLAYSLAITDVVLAPGMPSVTGRSAGIIMPIIQGVAKIAQNSNPGLSSYLILCSYHTTVVTSSMFLTAMAANPLIQEIASNFDVQISWSLWALGGLLPGLISIVFIPMIMMLMNPPQVKSMEGVYLAVQGQLDSLGQWTRKEIFVACTLFTLIVLWMFGDRVNINPVLTSMLGIILLVVSGALNWEDFLASKEMWNVFIWFSVIVLLASKLADFGIVDWISNHTISQISGLNWKAGLLCLLGVYFYSHYFFASSTAHVASMYLPFLAMGIKLGVPKLVCALSLGYASSLMGCLTHFGLSPGPILFGLGYVTAKKWWQIGLVMSLVHILIWLIIAPFWWSVLEIF